MKWMVRIGTVLAFGFGLCLVYTCMGCKNQQPTAQEAYSYMLASEAMRRPVLQAKGTSITITVYGTDTVPAEFVMYDSAIASDIVNKAEPSMWENAGLFIGGVIGSFMGANESSALASTNTVVIESRVIQGNGNGK